MTWRGTPTIGDRIFACLPYLLPLMYALPFGGSLMAQFPVLQVLLIPLQPVMAIYRIIPFAGLIVFFALFLLVVRNPSIPHFIRFNAMQAILIDLVLILCSLVMRFIVPALQMSLLAETLSNAIFLGTIAAVGYAIIQSIRGLYAEIPTLSEAAYMQVPR